MMSVTPEQQKIIEQIVNCFETGKKNGDYSALAIFSDGKDGRKQVTFGKCQATEDSGSLKALVMLCGDLELLDYYDRIGTGVLWNDDKFHNLLKILARTNSQMRDAQDQLFRDRYFNPALKWAMDNGFTLVLSMAVVYDSFIHSGRVPVNIRTMFRERLPVNGGNEKRWVESYVDARSSWLASANNPLLHNTVYRMKCFKQLIKDGNWALDKSPIVANGVKIL